MKKSTFRWATFALMALATPLLAAQGVSKMSAAGGETSAFVFAHRDRAARVEAQATAVAMLPAAQMKTDAKRVAQRAALTPADVAGTYIDRSWVAYVGHYSTYDGTTVAFPTEDSITITKLQGYDITIGGRVDWTTGVVTFQPQVIMQITDITYDADGNEVESLIDVTFSGDTASYVPVTGQIAADGSLSLGQWVGLCYFGEDELGAIWDYPISLFIGQTEFVKPNSAMHTTALDGKEYDYRTRIDYVSASQIAVTNFGGKAVIFIDLKPTGIVSIEPTQPFYFYNFYYYYASIYSPIYTDGQIDGFSRYRSIYGTATARGIDLEAWSVFFDMLKAYPRAEWMTTATTISLYDGVADLVMPVASDYGWAGSGSEADPYILESAADIERLAELVDGGNDFDKSYFRIIRDIDFDGSSFQGIATRQTATTERNVSHFDGILDGAGHRFLNLHIDAIAYDSETGKPHTNADTDPSYSYIGVVGELGGMVKNLIIDSSCSFAGYNYVGSIAGAMTTTLDVQVVGCRNYASVTAVEGYVGGLVGQSAYQNRIADCYNAGAVTGGNTVIGGVVGYSFRSDVANCQNDGAVAQSDALLASVSGNRNKVGGVAGYACGGSIKNCLNTGTVAAPASVGGLVGEIYNTFFRCDLSNCVNVGAVLGEQATTTGAAVGNLANGSSPSASAVYYDGQMRPVGATMGGDYAGVTAATTAVMTGGALSLDAACWTQAAGQYPRLTAFAAEGGDWAQAYVRFAEGENAFDCATPTEPIAAGVTVRLAVGTAFTLATDADGVRLVPPVDLLSIVYDTLFVTYGSYTTPVPLRFTPALVLAGSGTEDDPFLITSVEEYIMFAQFTNIYNESYEGKYLRLTKPLDFKGKEYVIPCSNGQCAFRGTFDGGKNTLSNVALNLGSDGTDANINKGLFGTIGAEGKVCNLALANSQVIGYSYIGAICGTLEGTLDNCATMSTTAVRAYAGHCGGLVGTMSGSALIKNCVNRAPVFGKEFVGGILGRTDDSTVVIENCRNYGHVYNFEEGRAGLSYVGGIAARYGGTVRGCENYGVIESQEDYAGGLVAYGVSGLKMEDCVNYGTVDTWSTAVVSGYAGGICGATLSNARGVTFTRCGNMGAVHAHFNYAGGVSAFANARFTDCWNMGDIIVDNVYGGGICGWTDNANTAFLRCWNTGSVLVGEANDWGWNAGGIIGNTDEFAVALDECWNAGHVETFRPVNEDDEDYAAGYYYTMAGGLVGYGNVILNDCFNVGHVASQKDCGGLLAMPAEEAAGHRCWNGGVVANFMDNTYAGNAVGTRHIYGSDFTDIYYDTDAAVWPYELDRWYTGVSRSQITGADMAAALGDKFDCTAPAAYPMLRSFAIDDEEPNALLLLGQRTAAVACATYILDAADTDSTVSGPIRLGLADVVTWDGEGFTISSDGYAYPTELGDASLTVSLDGTDYLKTFTFRIVATTAIDAVRADDTDAAAPAYDLLGRRVAPSAMERGRLYIRGGQKTIKL